MDIANWPKLRDVQERLGYAHPYTLGLLRAGRLRGVRTRLGWLIDPASVEEFIAERAAREAHHAAAAAATR